jgi:hypothetical protein
MEDRSVSLPALALGLAAPASLIDPPKALLPSPDVSVSADPAVVPTTPYGSERENDICVLSAAASGSLALAAPTDEAMATPGPKDAVFAVPSVTATTSLSTALLKDSVVDSETATGDKETAEAPAPAFPPPEAPVVAVVAVSTALPTKRAEDVEEEEDEDWQAAWPSRSEAASNILPACSGIIGRFYIIIFLLF